eukprot:2672326-Prymnesium_polylepis.1
MPTGLGTLNEQRLRRRLAATRGSSSDRGGTMNYHKLLLYPHTGGFTTCAACLESITPLTADERDATPQRSPVATGTARVRLRRTRCRGRRVR